jgi:ADP-ribose pyrophosphatase YjhB (NUDIX family)/SepF-like predicted cell division protein (DUF552 family)
MPGFASKRQYRMMMAILHEGNKAKTKRGDSGPPKSVISRYESSGKEDDLPESKDKSGPEHGGNWDNKKEKKHKKLHKSKDKAGVGIVVVSSDGCILLGRKNGEWSLPGGHIEGGETPEAAVIRELEEETGLKLKDKPQIIETREDNDTGFYVKLSDKPFVKDSSELQDVAFYNINSIDFNKIRQCSALTINVYAKKILNKSTKLVDMIAYEALEKNIIRSDRVADAVHEFTHGDALRLVGNGMFRILKNIIKDMGDDTISSQKIGNFTLHIRKHANDIYSGRVDDGLKTVYQFVNRSLPALTGELMSIFEWYTEEDFKEFEPIEDDKLPDEVIEEGIKKLTHNYRTKNLADIYDEIENIREEIRNGTAVDLQQAEHKIMSLFDKLEDSLRHTQEKHNGLAQKVGDDLDDVENKLRELQSKVEELSKKPTKVEAFSTEPANPSRVFNEFYSYLPRPKVVIEPNGRIIIDFSSEWTSDEKSNFLNDMKAKIIKRK